MKKNISLFTLYFLLFAPSLLAVFIGCTAKPQLVKKEAAPVQTVTPKEKYQQAKTLLEKGEAEQALQILKELLQLAPNLEDDDLKKINLLIVETEIKLAHQYFTLGEYEKTLNCLKQVKKIDREKYLTIVLLEEKAYRLLAEKFVQEKKYLRAIKIYEEMSAIYPEKSEIYKKEIKKLTLEGKIEKAKKLFEQREYQKASILYEEIFRQTGKKEIKLSLSEIYSHLGEISYREGDYPEARKYWQKGLEFVPENLKILFSLAEIFREEGNWKEAERYYLRVLELDKEKNYSQIYLLLGKYYRENKFYPQAKEYYEKYLSYSKEPNQRAEIYQELSQILSYLGLYRQAREKLLLARELNPELKKIGQYPLKFRLYYLVYNWQIYLYSSLGLISLSFLYFFLRSKILSFPPSQERKSTS